MDILVDQSAYFVFDVDDTLYFELDYLRSGYTVISDWLEPIIEDNVFAPMLEIFHTGGNVFAWIVGKYGHLDDQISLTRLLHIYRNHLPTISLMPGCFQFLQRLQQRNIPIGILTDGRSSSQRNKLRALNIDTIVRDVIISEEFGSEKPSIKNYEFFHEKNPNRSFWYVGDNTGKDFIVPKLIGWKTILISGDTRNIHKQYVDKCSTDYAGRWNEFSLIFR